MVRRRARRAHRRRSGRGWRASRRRRTFPGRIGLGGRVHVGPTTPGAGVAELSAATSMAARICSLASTSRRGKSTVGERRPASSPPLVGRRLHDGRRAGVEAMTMVLSDRPGCDGFHVDLALHLASSPDSAGVARHVVTGAWSTRTWPRTGWQKPELVTSEVGGQRRGRGLGRRWGGPAGACRRRTDPDRGRRRRAGTPLPAKR